MNNNSDFNVLLCLTGSVATIKAQEIVDRLLKEGVCVKVVVTESAKHFIRDLHIRVPVIDDSQEWRAWTKRGDPVLHIELRRWADVLLIGPLDANTMAKLCHGICDNLLTCVVRAWDMKKPVLFAPAMNTYMWEHPATATQIQQLQGLGYTYIPAIEKTLICGDKGKGAMASVDTIVAEVLHCRHGGANKTQQSAVTIPYIQTFIPSVMQDPFIYMMSIAVIVSFSVWVIAVFINGNI